MRRLLLLFLFLQVSLMFGAQFEIISELKVSPTHLGLMQLSDNDRLDNNGKLGALVIVNCGLKDVYFENMASKISQSDRSGAYWVVLKQRVQYFLIKKEGYPNYRYSFPSPLESGTVYEMTIGEKNPQLDETTLIITSNQNNAQVLVDGKLVGTTENRVFSGNVSLGTHQIQLSKSGFKTEQIAHNVTVVDNRLEINLEPAMPAAVTVTTEPEGARDYIENIHFGTSPKSSFFDAGTYSIRIEKESYAPINEEITIREPETKEHYVLKDVRATLTINTSENATIKLNGEAYQSVKNLKLPSSVVEIEVSQPKAKTIKQIVALQQEEIKTLDIYPEVEKGIITIVVIPTSAKIELTGDTGEHYSAIGRKSFSDIPIGAYQLVIANGGYKTHKETIRLIADQSVQKQISLEEDSDAPDGFIFVEGGTFTMGRTTGNGESDELPTHQVTLSSYYIGKYQVTQAEYKAVMGVNPSRFKGDNKPVENVSWYDAIEFCIKKSLKDGLDPVYRKSFLSTMKRLFYDNHSPLIIESDFSKNGYRLPTEAEWEYAARARTNSPDYLYAGSDNIDSVAWYKSNSGYATHKVGTKAPNNLGVYDMSGNVWEWCYDWKGSYSSDDQTNPIGSNSGSDRVGRGGSSRNNDSSCRVVERDCANPEQSNNRIGFRLIRSSN